MSPFCKKERENKPLEKTTEASKWLKAAYKKFSSSCKAIFSVVPVNSKDQQSSEHCVLWYITQSVNAPLLSHHLSQSFTLSAPNLPVFTPSWYFYVLNNGQLPCQERQHFIAILSPRQCQKVTSVCSKIKVYTT